MANIKLTLPGEPFTKQIVTFTAPCDCDKVTDGIVINGTTYTICDAMGNKVTGTGGVWCSGAQISVILDCENKKAYLQNGTPTDFVSKSGDTMNVGATLHFQASNETGLGIKAVSEGANITAYDKASDESSNRALLRIYPPSLNSQEKALRMAEVKDGKTKWVTVLHTGNAGSLLGDVAKVVTGSYRGTGTYGENNPNSLTFAHPVKFLCIFAKDNGSYHSTTNAVVNEAKVSVSDAELTTDWVKGVGLGMVHITHTEGEWGCYGKKSEDGKTVYWYDWSSASEQFNDDKFTYHYVAILA